MIFETDHRQRSPRIRRRYAMFEIAHTCADFGAALCFVIGSIFFFYSSLVTAGTWFFLLGSVLFAAKPTIRLIREVKLAAMGKDDVLAERLND